MGSFATESLASLTETHSLESVPRRKYTAWPTPTATESFGTHSVGDSFVTQVGTS